MARPDALILSPKGGQPRVGIREFAAPDHSSASASAFTSASSSEPHVQPRADDARVFAGGWASALEAYVVASLHLPVWAICIPLCASVDKHSRHGRPR